MDPNQTFRNLLLAVKEGDRIEAIAALTALSSWLERDGVMPDYSQAVSSVEGAENPYL